MKQQESTIEKLNIFKLSEIINKKQYVFCLFFDEINDSYLDSLLTLGRLKERLDFDLDVAQISIFEFSYLKEIYGVMSTPQFILFKDGKIALRILGNSNTLKLAKKLNDLYKENLDDYIPRKQIYDLKVYDSNSSKPIFLKKEAKKNNKNKLNIDKQNIDKKNTINKRTVEEDYEYQKKLLLDKIRKKKLIEKNNQEKDTLSNDDLKFITEDIAYDPTEMLNIVKVNSISKHSHSLSYLIKHKLTFSKKRKNKEWDETFLSKDNLEDDKTKNVKKKNNKIEKMKSDIKIKMQKEQNQVKEIEKSDNKKI